VFLELGFDHSVAIAGDIVVGAVDVGAPHNIGCAAIIQSTVRIWMNSCNALANFRKGERLRWVLRLLCSSPTVGQPKSSQGNATVRKGGLGQPEQAPRSPQLGWRLSVTC
jgi:hypothetical protein